MTAQVPDRLRYEGQDHSLFANPLEAYFDADHPRPPFQMMSTANWRGYVADWAIEDDRLFLVGLHARLANGEGGLETVFPEHRGPVEASWFTGDLRVPQGLQVRYVHMGYASHYERDLILTLLAGRLVLSEVHGNENPPRLTSWRIHFRPPGQLADEEWAFLQAVREEGEGTTSRLVYADWLDERGDRRGGFLRTWVREGLPPVRVLYRDPLSPLEEQAQGLDWLWLRLLGFPVTAVRHESGDLTRRLHRWQPRL